MYNKIGYVHIVQCKYRWIAFTSVSQGLLPCENPSLGAKCSVESYNIVLVSTECIVFTCLVTLSVNDKMESMHLACVSNFRRDI